MYKNSDLPYIVTIVQYMLIQTSSLGSFLFDMILFVSYNLLTVIHKKLLVKQKKDFNIKGQQEIVLANRLKLAHLEMDSISSPTSPTMDTT